MNRWRKLVLVVLGVVVAFGVALAWQFVADVRERDYVAEDLPVYRQSFFTWANKSFLLYDAMAIPGTERSCKDPVSGKMKTIYEYRVTLGPETVERLDRVNGRLAEKSNRLGDRFSDEALGRMEDERRYRKFFGGDRSAIEEYRQKLNSLDGVNRKLTVEDLTRDPTLVALAYSYTL